MGGEPFSAVFSAPLDLAPRFPSVNVRGRGFTARTRTTTRPNGLASSAGTGEVRSPSPAGGQRVRFRVDAREISSVRRQYAQSGLLPRHPPPRPGVVGAEGR